MEKCEVSTYLAGPIDNMNTVEAKKWRDEISIELSKRGIIALNPFGKFGGDRLAEIRGDLHSCSIEGRIDSIKSIVGNIIIPPDLQMVERCTFITVWIPKSSKEICGTYGEVTLAYYLGKPVYIVTNRSLEPVTLPKWIIGCSTQIFTSWKAYLDYIDENWTK